MKLRKLIWRVPAALIVLAAAASIGEYYSTVYRWRAYTQLVDTFLALGARADTAALRRVVSDSGPVLQVLATPPRTLERLRQSLQLRWAIRNGDTVVVDYAAGRAGCYQVRLLRQDSGWLVAQARPEPC